MTFDWDREKREHKTVILCNVEDFQKLPERQLRYMLLGMGLCEWETYMERVLMNAVNGASEKGESKAEVTEMFSCDLIGVDECGEYRKNQSDVKAFLLNKLFEVVADEPEVLYVKLKHD